MREGTSEFAFLNLFTNGLQAHLPLGTEDKLGSEEFPVPFSYILGESDWMRLCD